MKELIQGYTNSCKLVQNRIHELTQTMNELKKNGNEVEIKEQNLERRIQLLYTEHRQMHEIIQYLTSYMRRIEQRVEKKNLL